LIARPTRGRRRRAAIEVAVAAAPGDLPRQMLVVDLAAARLPSFLSLATAT
jgi:hypothetical protein